MEIHFCMVDNIYIHSIVDNSYDVYTQCALGESLSGYRLFRSLIVIFLSSLRHNTGLVLQIS
jgi:hypothetical protein